MRNTSWKRLLDGALERRGESWDDVESNTMSEVDMVEEFDSGFGGINGCSFTVWTADTIYFPACYDGSEWVDYVSRNPDGRPTSHVGGG